MEHRGKRDIGKRKRVIILLMIMLITISSAFASDEVRVGFFAMDGYHMIDKEGNRSGYGYELLQLIGRHTPYTFQYIGYDKSWADMQEMLSDGQLDIVTSAAKTAEREELFEFSRNPVGTNYTILTVGKDSPIIAHNYASYENMRVGLLRSSTKNAAFVNFANQHGIAWIPCWYDDFNEMEADLKTGTIDAIVSSSLRDTTGERIIEKLDRNDFYIMAPKGERTILNVLDAAIDEIEATDPGWLDALMYRSYLRTDSGDLSISEEEAEYLKSTKLSVLMCPDRKPYSYFDGGKPSGIMPAILETVAQKNGLTLEFIVTRDRKEYVNEVEKGTADIILDLPSNPSKAEDYGYKLTDSYLNAGVIQLTLSSFQGQVRTIATMEDSTQIRRYLEKYFPEFSFSYYDSIDECIKALDSGKVDATCFYSLTSQDILNTTRGQRYSAMILSDTETSFSVGVRSDLRPALLKVINRSLSEMQDSETLSIMINEASSDHEVTLAEYLYGNPAMLLILILGTGIMIAAGCIAAASLAAGKRLRKANAMLSDANSAKREFLSKMSHDMRTPMNAIIGFTNLALKCDDIGETHACLEKISSSADHLLMLINDVLDISRIEGGAVAYTPEPTNICTITDSVISIVHGLLTERKLEFIVERPSGGHCCVSTDGLRLREILVNLLSNAIKFTDDGGKVTFSMGMEAGWDEEHVTIWFTVTDTGCGMSEDFLPHVFDDFAQEANSARTKYAGTGLGMAISKQYARLMGGDLTVRSRKGEGSSFTLTLPCALADICDVKQEEEVNDTAIDLTGKKVLLAEDNDLNAEIATAMLEEQKMKVIRAENGEEAVKLFTSSPEGTFDIILMDIMMPVMDGLAATAEIRTSREDGKYIPIIAMTANAFAEDVQASLNAGMNGHISKPIDMKKMMSTIQRCMHTGSK